MRWKYSQSAEEVLNRQFGFQIFVCVGPKLKIFLNLLDCSWSPENENKHTFLHVVVALESTFLMHLFSTAI